MTPPSRVPSGTHLLALAKRRGLLTGLWISTGNEAWSMQVADGISSACRRSGDRGDRLLYIEAIKDRDRFVDAVSRARAAGKPVIAMKVGGLARRWSGWSGCGLAHRLASRRH